MASEAIARIVRTGGATADTLRQLNQETREALRLMERVNPAIGQARRLWESLRSTVEGGKATGEEIDRFRSLTQTLEQRGRQLTQMGIRPMAAAERQMYGHRAPEDLDRAVMLGGNAFFPKRPPASTLSLAEREHFRSLGYTDAELSTATRLGKNGPLIIRPPMAAPRADAPQDAAVRRETSASPLRPIGDIRAEKEAFDRSIEQAVGKISTGDSDREALRRSLRGSDDYRRLEDELGRAEAAESSGPVAAVRRRLRSDGAGGSGSGAAAAGAAGSAGPDPTVGKAAEGLKKLSDEKERHNRIARISTMTDIELGRAWKDQTQTLRSLQGEIRLTEKGLDVLNSAKKAGLEIDEKQLELHDKSVRRLHKRRAFGLDRLQRMESELGRRGLAVPGGGPSFRNLLGAFLGGAGIGGGSAGGTAAGLALGYLNPYTAGLALTGMAAGYAWNTARDAYAMRVGTLPNTIPIASTMGVDPDSVNDEIAARTQAARIYRSQELVSAMRTLHRGTGRLDQWRPVVDTATIAGVSPQEQAAMIARLTRQSSGYDRMLPDVLLDAYRLSDIPKGSNDFSRFPAGVDTSLLFPFEEAVSGLAGSQAQSPLTRVSMRGLSAQLSAASHFGIPGIEEHTNAKLDADVATVSGLNRLLANPQGVFRDLAFSAVQELRGTPEAARLKEDLDIDIEKFSDVWRAIRRSPELAQRTDRSGRHYDAVARAIMRKHRTMFGSAEGYENALMLNTSIDPEVAHQIATKPFEETLGAELWNVGPAPHPISSDAAEQLTRQDAFRAVYESGGPRDDVIGLQAADRTGVHTRIDQLGNDLNRTVAEGMDRMTERLVGLLSGTDVTGGREHLGPVER